MQSDNIAQAPNTFNSLWTIISLELERTFASRQGLFYILSFIVFWYFLLRFGVFNESHHDDERDNWG